MEAYVFLADGFEEIEALAPVDILRRSGISVFLVSVTGSINVRGSHGITIVADILFEQGNYSAASLLFLPGGMPGTTNLDMHELLKKTIKDHVSKNALIAAICAAPRILGNLGLLQGKNATCYPGSEPYLVGAHHVPAPVVIDGNIVTANGVGSAVELGLTLVRILKSDTEARKLAASIMVNN